MPSLKTTKNRDMIKPGIPQGTRDFSAAIVRRRQFILQNIRDVFEKSGYEPLETPAMELLETLTGKYGEEGDKLMFKILNNGLNDPANIEKARVGFEKVLEGKSNTDVTSRALRYDLTIPFARFVAMNRGTLSFPFKRYQIQPVWRADRPQKGRYREFTQCDADVVGSTSLWNEVELVHIYRNAFNKLGLNDVPILINNRKILSALAEKCGAADQLTNITIAIDKLDKIGLEKVKEELSMRGMKDEQIKIIEQYLNITGSNSEKMKALETLIGESDTALKGIEELKFVLKNAARSQPSLDLKLARGLDYYTGIIYEVKAPDSVKMGSIGGGGRYDNLTGLFGVDGLSGVGISFGVDRIYDVMDALGLFESKLEQTIQVLVFNNGEACAEKAAEIAFDLQQSGISAMFYPDPVKMDKQFKYADKKSIPYVITLNTEGLEKGTVIIKKLNTDIQSEIPFNTILSHLQNQ